MFGIGFNRPRSGRNFISMIDKFVDSEIFKSESGLEINDVNVFAKVQSDPALAARVREQLIVQDIKGFDESVSDEDVFKSLEEKYSSASSALAAVKGRISEIRTKEIADKRFNDYLEQIKKEDVPV